MPYLLPLAPERNPATQRIEIGVGVEIPSDLDPAVSPIIAQHWFGWRPVGEVAAVIVSDLRSRCQAKRQYAAGPG